MRLSDGLLIAMNGALLFWSFAGFASVDDDTLMVGAMLAMAVSVVNGVVFFRRRTREPAEPRRAVRRKEPEDEMDARTILDLDARLEALELAHTDAADAARWRALVESGAVSPPGAEPVEDPSAAGARLNGRA